MSLDRSVDWFPCGLEWQEAFLMLREEKQEWKYKMIKDRCQGYWGTDFPDKFIQMPEWMGVAQELWDTQVLKPFQVLPAWGPEHVWSKPAANKLVIKTSRCYFGPIQTHSHYVLISKLFALWTVRYSCGNQTVWIHLGFFNIMISAWQFYSFDWYNEQVYREHFCYYSVF